MDSSLLSTRPPPHTSTSSLSTRRSKFFAPLTPHGMPKAPLPTSPGFHSHRFTALRSPPLTPMSHMSTGPMSPPMSAKSFGTFIESEPSTPAYSPRSGSSHWDSNTLLLLSPVSSAPSSPISPSEPVWDMVTPIRKSKSQRQSNKGKSLLRHGRTISMSRSDSPTSFHTTESTTPKQRETTPQPEQVDGLAEADAERSSTTAETPHTAPLEKLATRVKSILRRKTVSEKKKKSDKAEKRRREFADLDRMEDVHWTEM